jgi:hypothetical protein
MDGKVEKEKERKGLELLAQEITFDAKNSSLRVYTSTGGE